MSSFARSVVAVLMFTQLSKSQQTTIKNQCCKMDVLLQNFFFSDAADFYTFAIGNSPIMSIDVTEIFLQPRNGQWQLKYIQVDSNAYPNLSITLVPEIIPSLPHPFQARIEFPLMTFGLNQTLIYLNSTNTLAVHEIYIDPRFYNCTSDGCSGGCESCQDDTITPPPPPPLRPTLMPPPPFTILPPPPMPPAIYLDCAENPTIIFNDEKIEEIGLKDMDQIIISRQRLDDTENLDHKCITSFQEKTFHFNLTDCDPYVVENNDDITYTWTIRKQPYIDETVAVQRFDYDCFNVSCVFDKRQLLDFEGIDPKLKKKIQESEEEDGKFDIELTVYKDANLANKLGREGVIQVPDYIYAKVELVNVDPINTNLFVQIEDCKATPSSSFTDSTFYTIIDSGCAASHYGESADAINVTRNYELQNAAFKFRSFVWTGDFNRLIYLHCEVKICDGGAKEANCNSLDCSSKRKRRDTDTQSQLVVFGPVRVSSKEFSSHCSHNNGGCSDVCFVIDGDVVCSCYDGKTLMHDGKTCYADDVPFEPVSDGGNHTVMVVAMILACASVIISCARFCMMGRAGKKKVVKM